MARFTDHYPTPRDAKRRRFAVGCALFLFVVVLAVVGLFKVWRDIGQALPGQ